MAIERLALRPGEVGDSIGVSRSKAYALIASGAIPSIRIGSSIRVTPDALKAYLESQLVDQSSGQ